MTDTNISLNSGTYAFRFTGYEMDEDVELHIMGLGTMVLNPDETGGGDISDGEQSASITRLSGSNATLDHSKFSLKGSYKTGDPGLYHATIWLDEIGGKGRKTRGEFDFVAVASDKFWLISTATYDLTEDGASVDEGVSGEAVWIKPLD